MMLTPLSGLGCERGNRLHVEGCGWVGLGRGIVISASPGFEKEMDVQKRS